MLITRSATNRPLYHIPYKSPHQPEGSSMTTKAHRRSLKVTGRLFSKGVYCRKWQITD